MHILTTTCSGSDPGGFSYDLAYRMTCTIMVLIWTAHAHVVLCRIYKVGELIKMRWDAFVRNIWIIVNDVLTLSEL